MKKIAILGLVTLMCASAMAQTDDSKYLTAQSTTGSQSVELSIVHKITFADGNAVINVVSGEPITLPLATLQKMYFTSEPTAIAALPGEAEGLKVNAGSVSVSENGLLCVYKMNGQLVSLAKVAAGQNVNISTLPAGTYIIKLGDKAIRVTK